MSAPRVATASSLRTPWAGFYVRPDGRREMTLQLYERKDGSGMLGWKIGARAGWTPLQPGGTISSGGCKVIDVTHMRAGAALRVPVEERLVFESRWGTHTLKWAATAGSAAAPATIEEENLSGAARSVHVWTREVEGEAQRGKSGAPFSLW